MLFQALSRDGALWQRFCFSADGAVMSTFLEGGLHAAEEHAPRVANKAPESHVRIIRPATAFRRDPDDVLRRVLDIARLAMHAVLRIDHEPLAAVVVLHEFIDRGRAVARFGTGISS